MISTIFSTSQSKQSSDYGDKENDEEDAGRIQLET